MNKRILLTIAFLALASLSLILAASGGGIARAQGEIEGLPTPRPADDLVAAPTPDDDRQVALLTLRVLSNEDGQVVGVEIVESEFLGSFAPNVIGLSGPWAIALVGEEIISYGVLDPRLVRMEGDEDSPHSSFIDPDLEWQLVVPLYDGGQDLRVVSIAIADDEGNIVFAALIDSENSELMQIEIGRFIELLGEGGLLNNRLLGPGLTVGE